MGNRLFETDGVNVDYTDEKNSEWTVGFDLQANTTANSLDVQDYCIALDNVHLAGTAITAQGPGVYTALPFAALVSAFRHVRCSLEDELAIANLLLMGGGAVSAAEYALWYGLPGWDADVRPSLQNNDVSHVAAATLPQDSVAAAIVRYAALTSVQNFVVHLGVKSALDLSAQGYVYSDYSGGQALGGTQQAQIRLRATDSPVVVSPYYPASAVAVTGPIEILVAPAESWQVYDPSLNRTQVSAYQLISLAFDPSTAVVAA